MAVSSIKSTRLEPSAANITVDKDPSKIPVSDKSNIVQPDKELIHNTPTLADIGTSTIMNNTVINPNISEMKTFNDNEDNGIVSEIPIARETSQLTNRTPSMIAKSNLFKDAIPVEPFKSINNSKVLPSTQSAEMNSPSVMPFIAATSTPPVTSIPAMTHAAPVESATHVKIMSPVTSVAPVTSVTPEVPVTEPEVAQPSNQDLTMIKESTIQQLPPNESSQEDSDDKSKVPRAVNETVTEIEVGENNVVSEKKKKKKDKKSKANRTASEEERKRRKKEEKRERKEREKENQ